MQSRSDTNQGCAPHPGTISDAAGRIRAACIAGSRWGWLVVLSLLGLPLWAGAQPSKAPEATVKAAYLVKFTSYTTWPTNALPSRETPVVIGVLGKDSLGENLDQQASGVSGGHSIKVIRVSDAEAAARCHVVFISKEESRNEEAWLAALKDKPILTVGESAQSIERGAVIRLVTEAKGVRYEVSWRAMDRSGLKISPEMLAYAKTVHHRPASKP